MQTAAIVILSVLGGILFVILIAGIVTMIVLHIRTQKLISEHETFLHDFTEETTSKMMDFAGDIRDLLLEHRGETTGIIEGARSSFAGIRADIKTSLETQSKNIGKVLKEHETAFRETTGKINGQALEAASVRGLQACVRMEKVALLLNQLVMSHEVMPTNNLAPEEYGPSDTIYGKQSDAGRLDEVDLESEVEEMQPQYSSGMTE